jgi:hypothetical protein
MPICGGHAKRPAPMAERRGACPSWAGKRQAPEASLALSCGVTLAELCSKACANARKITKVQGFDRTQDSPVDER